MLRKIRLTAAVIFFTLITLLFLDFTGTIHQWFGWMAKIQFLPALLAVNIGIVIGLVVLTLLFGRIYCSVICPLGVFQDVVSWIAGKQKKNRFSYSPAVSWLRYGILAMFILAMIGGFGSLLALLAPYSAYGRIASNLFAPFYQWANNGLAYLAERMDSYAFYTVDVWMKGIATFSIAIITFIVLAILAWRNGRTYCNTICPVGTILGFLARYSYFKPVIDTEKCNGCGLCARNCKAACINTKEHRIDYSRCVACMDCIGKCRRNALKYVPGQSLPKKQVETTTSPSASASVLPSASAPATGKIRRFAPSLFIGCHPVCRISHIEGTSQTRKECRWRFSSDRRQTKAGTPHSYHTSRIIKRTKLYRTLYCLPIMCIRLYQPGTASVR